jgi:hypothetical protein
MTPLTTKQGSIQIHLLSLETVTIETPRRVIIVATEWYQKE